MDKLLSKARSKSKERQEKSDTQTKLEDLGATALEEKIIPNTLNIDTMDSSTTTPSRKKFIKLPDDLIEPLTDQAEPLPDDEYGEIITREDGAPIYYFGAAKFPHATKAIWRFQNKIYALDPRRIKIPEDFEQENIYENPEETKHTFNGARPKQHLQNIEEVSQDQKENLTHSGRKTKPNKDSENKEDRYEKQFNDLNDKINSMMEIFLDSKLEPKTHSRNQSPIRKPELHDYGNAINQAKQYVCNIANEDTLEEKFCKFLLKQSKIVAYITPLDHEQGPSYASWLQSLTHEMEFFAIPLEFIVPLAIRKLPDKIRTEIIPKRIITLNQLDEALYNIYCGTKNSVSLKTQFLKDNKLAPHDRNYNNLRDKIKRKQAPMIVSVERVGQNDIPSVKERLVEETSERVATELFLQAIQDDCKRSVLNKGRYNSFDELVQRANDFASSISDEQPIRNRINNITDKPKCKIHPLGIHAQQDCKLKCPQHPWSDHKARDCNSGQNQNGQTIPYCHPSRAGKHSEPLWCLFCNTVEPKLENNKCTHCWRCSTAQSPMFSRDCQCPAKPRK